MPMGMQWATAQAWIAAMNTAAYLGFSDWRLPTTPDSGGPIRIRLERHPYLHLQLRLQYDDQ